ncbi:MAG: TetR/AcrR family transcriptional regulator [Caulobacteraceae bacterium]|nr:TetR/AcrR family transcriptional regulator [Caulobacteraceae bacterium]
MPKVLSQEDVSGFRERLCAAAERLFAEHGPDAVSMRQLSAEVGVSAMTPYRYFKDKDDILAAVRASGFNRFAAALEAASEANPEPAARAGAVGAAYIRFAFDNPAAYRLMFDLSQPTETDYPELVRAEERARRTMSAYVHSLIEAGLIEAGDPEMIAHVFWAAIHGLVVLKLAGKLSPDMDFETLRSEMFRALGEGFRPRDEPS